MQNDLRRTINVEGRGDITVNHFPDTCPWCGRSSDAKFIKGHSLGDKWNYEEVVENIFQCNRNDCGRYFIGYFNKPSRMDAWFVLRTTKVPYYHEPVNLPDLIKKISPKFASIYDQASTTEDYGLTQICGGGYRKAIEFLMKDYLIKKYPDKKEEIKTSWLGTLIETMTDGNIKACVKRATWLGNDELHYLREWKNKDIGNLKDLIDLTLNWIISEIKTKKYIKEMSEKNK